jgi:hypothetical protein
LSALASLNHRLPAGTRVATRRTRAFMSGARGFGGATGDRVFATPGYRRTAARAADNRGFATA